MKGSLMASSPNLLGPKDSISQRMMTSNDEMQKGFSEMRLDSYQDADEKRPINKYSYL